MIHNFFRACNPAGTKSNIHTINSIYHTSSYRNIQNATGSLLSIVRNRKSATPEENDTPTHQRGYDHDELTPLSPGELIVKNIANEIRQKVRRYSQKHQLGLIGIAAAKKRPPPAPILTENDDDLLAVHDDIETYSEWVAKTCMEDGINYEFWKIPIPTASLSNTSSFANTDDNNFKDMIVDTELICERMKHIIQRANELPGSNGIIVYYPIINRPILLLGQKAQRYSFSSTNMYLRGIDYKTVDDHFRDLVCSTRDVEGLCPTYHSRQNFRNSDIYIDQSRPNQEIHHQDKMIFPCTALAVVRILQRCLNKKMFCPMKPLGERFDSTTVTIINRSEILGRPLASMLASDGCTVYSVDEKSVILYSPRNGRMRRLHLNCKVDESISSVPIFRDAIQNASVIVTAVPSARFKIPSEWIQPNSVVVNVASEPNVNEDDLLYNENGVLYIPQIGKVVCSLLEHNLVTLHKRHHQEVPR